MKGGVFQRPPTPPATAGRFVNPQQLAPPTTNGVIIPTQVPSTTTLTPYITVERKPLNDVNSSVNYKMPASTSRDAYPNSAKIPKFRESGYENVTPTHTADLEEVDFTSEMYQEFFQSTMN